MAWVAVSVENIHVETCIASTGVVTEENGI